MKRSQGIRLVLMGSVALSLAACEEPEIDAAVFDSVEQCIKIDGFTEAQCREQYQIAAAKHEAVAPKYSNREDCEADFGAENCQSSERYTGNGGSGIFLPLFAGYMMGRALGGGGVAAQPLYKSADDRNTFRTADNKKVGAKTGPVKVAKSATRAPAQKLYTSSRGGFGARAGTVGA
jgi:uncharacterized protein YgiB involved in biofilm formation